MFCKGCGKSINTASGNCAHCGRPVDALSGGTGFWDLVANAQNRPAQPLIRAESSMAATLPPENNQFARNDGVESIAYLDNESHSTERMQQATSLQMRTEPNCSHSNQSYLFIGIGFVLGILVSVLIGTLVQCAGRNAAEQSLIESSPIEDQAEDPSLDQSSSDTSSISNLDAADENGYEQNSQTQDAANLDAVSDAELTDDNSGNDHSDHGAPFIAPSHDSAASSNSSADSNGTAQLDSDTTDRQQEEAISNGQ